jgi:hypothetical protein
MKETKQTDEEARWIKRLRRVMKDCPSTVYLFSNGSMHVMRRAEDGGPSMRGNSHDPEAVLATIEGVYSEGGGW